MHTQARKLPSLLTVNILTPVIDEIQQLQFGSAETPLDYAKKGAEVS